MEVLWCWSGIVLLVLSPIVMKKSFIVFAMLMGSVYVEPS